MARKSRKNIPEVVSSATAQTEMSRPFRAGLYARISMETEEILERGTIETQVELMKNFVADTEDISVAEVYKDSDSPVPPRRSPPVSRQRRSSTTASSCSMHAPSSA